MVRGRHGSHWRYPLRSSKLENTRKHDFSAIVFVFELQGALLPCIYALASSKWSQSIDFLPKNKDAQYQSTYVRVGQGSNFFLKTGQISIFFLWSPLWKKTKNWIFFKIFFSLKICFFSFFLNFKREKIFFQIFIFFHVFRSFLRSLPMNFHQNLHFLPKKRFFS